MIIASGIIGGSSTPAVTFDGSNDYLSKASSLTGIADGQLGLLSFWIKAAAPGSSQYLAYFGSAGRLRVFISASTGYISVAGFRSTGASCLNMDSTTTPAANGNWRHVLAAWDLSADASCKVYIDGSDVTTLNTRTANNIDYATAGPVTIGADNTGAFKLGADVAELYFTTEWLDITSSTNRQKFAKNGRPVALGSDGSKPTGTAPLIYLRGPASNWGTNSGTGGDFSVVGAFTDAATKPSY